MPTTRMDSRRAMARTADILVVGLGASGSAAAYHAALHGDTVLGFDASTPPHQGGSSHGGSRIIRKAYFEGAFYVPFLQRAYALWQDLEARTGQHLLHETGILMIGPPDAGLVAGARAAAEQHNLPYRMFSADAARRHHPAFDVPDDQVALWEAEAGWLDPELCIQTHLTEATRLGATLHYDTPITGWHATDTSVTVTTRAGEQYEGARLLLCAGGWMTDLLPSARIPLHIERQVNVWFTPQSEVVRDPNLPVYLWQCAPDQLLYGFPHRGAGLKAGLHYHGAVTAHPDAINRTVTAADVDALVVPMQRLFNDAVRPSDETMTCFYTVTPDKHYLVDQHPAADSVWVVSACSGHGFKASNAIAAHVVELVTERTDIALPQAFAWR
ncbi:MAG: N-methyl-L-tryptophan oxidase [Bacteroidota bacterium]